MIRSFIVHNYRGYTISGKLHNAGSLPDVEYNRSQRDAFQIHMVSPTSRNPQHSAGMNANQLDRQMVEQFSQVPPVLRPADLDSLRVGNAVAVSRRK